MVTEHRSYELLQVVGRGGFGTVYRARFTGEGGFSKEVALKLLNADMEGVAEVASRLRDEARMLGLLRHRAIVQVDRLTQIDGRWAVVMEYVEGHSLTRLLRLGPVPPTVALEIAAEVAGALDTAFTRIGPKGTSLCVIHRDIKPSNIQITAQGEVKVLDFGIARAEFDARESQTRSLAFGTPEYMSPERLDMAHDGPEGDVYALGGVLFELLVGAPLGRTSARRDRHEARLLQALEFLGDLPGVDQGLVDLVGTLLAWAPQHRPSAREVERRCIALRSELKGEPLRFWAARTLPAMAVEAETSGASGAGVVENLTGSILVERPGAPATGADETRWESARITPGASPGRRVTPVPTPTHTRSARAERGDRRPTSSMRRFLPLVLLALVLMLSASAVGFALWAGWRDARETSSAARASPRIEAEDRPESAPALTATSPTPKPPRASTEVKPLPEPAAPVATPSPVTTGRRRSPAAAPEPPRVLIRLTGDLTRLRLVGDHGKTSYEINGEGRVPSGTYDVLAYVGEPLGWIALNTVPIPEGDQVGLRCVLAFKMCREIR